MYKNYVPTKKFHNYLVQIQMDIKYINIPIMKKSSHNINIISIVYNLNQSEPRFISGNHMSKYLYQIRLVQMSFKIFEVPRQT